MNKQELIAHFQEQKRIAESEIAFWQAQPDDKSEKPKLRHGDFGTNKDNSSFVATEGYLPVKKLEPYYENAESDGCDYAKSNPNDYTIFGNIFDLMKDWGEDLTHFKFDVHEYKIDTREFAHAPIHIAGNWHTLVEAEEIWRKLGQMIMTKKRKEAK